MTVGGPVQSQGLTAFQRKCPASRRKDTFQVEHTPRVPVVFLQEEHCSYLDDVWVLAHRVPRRCSCLCQSLRRPVPVHTARKNVPMIQSCWNAYKKSESLKPHSQIRLQQRHRAFKPRARISDIIRRMNPKGNTIRLIF